MTVPLLAERSLTALGEAEGLTIPQEIRERTGLLPHTEVEFLYDGKTVQIRRADGKTTNRGARIVEHMRGRGTIKLTTDEIMAMTRR